MKITNPELEVVRFAAEDVLATSMFYVADPASDTGYYRVYGSMAPSGDAGTWIVGYHPYNKDEVDEAEVLQDREDASPYAYDAYIDPMQPGVYYTHGANYFELYGGN